MASKCNRDMRREHWRKTHCVVRLDKLPKEIMFAGTAFTRLDDGRCLAPSSPSPAASAIQWTEVEAGWTRHRKIVQDHVLMQLRNMYRHFSDSAAAAGNTGGGEEAD